MPPVTIHLERGWECRTCLRIYLGEWPPGECRRCFAKVFAQIDVYKHKGCKRNHSSFQAAAWCAGPSPHKPSTLPPTRERPEEGAEGE